jgi:hypothetical protein
MSSIKDVRSSVAIADKPDIASTARFGRKWTQSGQSMEQWNNLSLVGLKQRAPLGAD